MMVFNACMMHINDYYILFVWVHWYYENNCMHMVKRFNTLCPFLILVFYIDIDLYTTSIK